MNDQVAELLDLYAEPIYYGPWRLHSIHFDSGSVEIVFVHGSGRRIHRLRYSDDSLVVDQMERDMTQLLHDESPRNHDD